MKNFYKPGQIMTIIGAFVAGSVAQVGQIIGVVANTTTEATDENEMATSGVFLLQNPDGIAIARGELVGYVLADQKIAAAGAGDFNVGHAWEDIAATDLVDVKVRLIGGGEGSAY